MVTENLLKQYSIFSQLTGAKLKTIIRELKETEYEPGVVIFKEGDSAAEILILQEGKVALQKTLSTRQDEVMRKVTVDTVNPQEVITWLASNGMDTYVVSGMCLRKSKVLHVKSFAFEKLVSETPELYSLVLKEFIKILALRLDETRSVLASERLMSIEK